MKKILFLIVALAGVFLMAGCLNDSTPMTTSYSAGDGVEHTAGSVSFDMHYVPSGGPFTMGEDVPQNITRDVTLTKNFWMGKTEVSQGLWEAVWGGWPGTAPSSNYGEGDDYPVYNVSWYNAAAFCNLLTLADSSIADDQQVYYSDAGLQTVYTILNSANNDDVYTDWDRTGYRLPTEAEWEYAARYIDGTGWNGGDHVSGDTSAPYDTSAVIGDYAWYLGNNGASGTPTYGSKEVTGVTKPNALGLKDMSGNVNEWCYDWHAAYTSDPQTDPTGPDSGTFRVGRGGRWDFSNYYLRCAYRNTYDPSSRNYFVGFRLCRTAD